MFRISIQYVKKLFETNKGKFLWISLAQNLLFAGALLSIQRNWTLLVSNNFFTFCRFSSAILSRRYRASPCTQCSETGSWVGIKIPSRDWSKNDPGPGRDWKLISFYNTVCTALNIFTHFLALFWFRQFIGGFFDNLG